MTVEFKKSEVLKKLDTQFRAEFSKGIAHIQPQYPKIAMTVPSNTATNTYGFMRAFPKMTEWVGKRTIKNMSAVGMTLENKRYETVGVRVKPLKMTK